MPDLATMLPCRRPDLVSWTTGNEGDYLIRNRRTGETFQLGEQEHFLLSRLDGRHSAADICAAFAQRFGEPLSEADLAEFLDLAGTRDFLHSDGAAGPETLPADAFQVCSPSPSQTRQGPASLRRCASRLLSVSAGMLQRLGGFLTGVAQRIHGVRLRRFEFVPRLDDIFIVTYPRSGTTWMQMILYQLTTDGNMDFPHIAEYCPWFERSLRSGRGFETRPSPRLFKSHLSYQQIPKGPGKYVYVARDGKDVAVSCYHLYRRYNGYEGTFPEFFEDFLRGKVEFGSWFRHVRGWWAHRHDPNVLFLTYEELTHDLEGCIRRISAFCGLTVLPERWPSILDRCRFAFMKQHESRFDPALETLWEQGVQLNGFLRHGRTGDGTVHLSSDQSARFSEAFQRTLGRTGFAWDGRGV